MAQNTTSPCPSPSASPSESPNPTSPSPSPSQTSQTSSHREKLISQFLTSQSSLHQITSPNSTDTYTTPTAEMAPTNHSLKRESESEDKPEAGAGPHTPTNAAMKRKREHKRRDSASLSPVPVSAPKTPRTVPNIKYTTSAIYASPQGSQSQSYKPSTPTFAPTPSSKHAPFTPQQHQNSAKHAPSPSTKNTNTPSKGKNTQLIDLENAVDAHEDANNAAVSEMRDIVRKLKAGHPAEVAAAGRGVVALRAQNDHLQTTITTLQTQINTIKALESVAKKSAEHYKTMHDDREAAFLTNAAAADAAITAQKISDARLAPVTAKLAKLQEIGERVNNVLVTRIETLAELSKKYDAVVSASASAVGAGKTDAKGQGTGGAAAANTELQKQELLKQIADQNELLVFGWERMEGDYRLQTQGGRFWIAEEGGEGEGVGAGLVEEVEGVEEGEGGDGRGGG